MFEVNALQKCGRSINTDKRHFVGIQFLERFDATAAATLALRRVDDLPRLVVTLFDAIARFAEVEDDADEHGEAAEVFEHFKKAPAAEPVGCPLQHPLDTPEG